jgi:hypothetical protein
LKPIAIGSNLNFKGLLAANLLFLNSFLELKLELLIGVVAAFYVRQVGVRIGEKINPGLRHRLRRRPETKQI